MASCGLWYNLELKKMCKLALKSLCKSNRIARSPE